MEALKLKTVSPHDLQELNSEIAQVNAEISDLKARRDALQFQKSQYHIHQAQISQEGEKTSLSVAYRKEGESPNGDFEWVRSFLNVSRSTITRYINNKSLPAHRIGGRWSFIKADVEEWYSKHKKETPEERKNRVLKNLGKI